MNYWYPLRQQTREGLLCRWWGVTLSKVHFSSFSSLSSPETSAYYLCSCVLNLPWCFTDFNSLVCSGKNWEVAKLKSQHYPSLCQGLFSLTLWRVFGRTEGDSLEDWGRANVKPMLLTSFFLYIYIFFKGAGENEGNCKPVNKTLKRKGIISSSMKP